MHYDRFIKTGDPNLNLSGRYVGKRNTCIIDGVGVVEGYGYCRKHYKAYKKYGESLHKRLAYLKGNKIIEATEYAAKIGKPTPVVLNTAKRQTIPAFREKGIWKIGS